MTAPTKRLSPDQQREIERKTQITNEIDHIREDARHAVVLSSVNDAQSAIYNLHAAIIRLCDLLEASL